MITKERADAYIGHSWEVGEDPSITMARNGYESGYKDAINQVLGILTEYDCPTIARLIRSRTTEETK